MLVSREGAQHPYRLFLLLQIVGHHRDGHFVSRFRGLGEQLALATDQILVGIEHMAESLASARYAVDLADFGDLQVLAELVRGTPPSIRIRSAI